MFNKKASLIITVALSTALLLSGCGNSTAELVDETILESTVLQTSAETTTTAEATTEATTAVITATTTKTTTETKTETEAEIETTQERELTPEEVEIYDGMPDIVFVMSYQIDDDNIFGCYVMKTGEIKLFDFRSIAPSEIYDVKDVYDRLEEAGCERLEPRTEIYWSDEDYDERLITEDELNILSQDKIIGYYKRLLLIEGDAEYIKWGYVLDSYWGYYKLYGIKKNEQGVNECIILSGYGADSEYLHNNPDAEDIYGDFKRLLPNLQRNALSY